MNIFRVDNDPIKAAQMLCNTHVVKMVLESAQMLSTAHRMLDGKQDGKLWIHPDIDYNTYLYKVVHKNHPCTIWTREGYDNYMWHYEHFKALSDEYTFRYGKVHKTWQKLGELLFYAPRNIPNGSTPFRPAVGPDIKGPTIVETYRTYYKTKKDNFKMIWSKRDVPEWFNA
jgi:hypothetical protein